MFALADAAFLRVSCRMGSHAFLAARGFARCHGSAGSRTLTLTARGTRYRGGARHRHTIHLHILPHTRTHTRCPFCAPHHTHTHTTRPTHPHLTLFHYPHPTHLACLLSDQVVFLPGSTTPPPFFSGHCHYGLFSLQPTHSLPPFLALQEDFSPSAFLTSGQEGRRRRKEEEERRWRRGGGEGTLTPHCCFLPRLPHCPCLHAAYLHRTAATACPLLRTLPFHTHWVAHTTRLQDGTLHTAPHAACLPPPGSTASPRACHLPPPCHTLPHLPAALPPVLLPTCLHPCLLTHLPALFTVIPGPATAPATHRMWTVQITSSLPDCSGTLRTPACPMDYRRSTATHAHCLPITVVEYATHLLPATLHTFPTAPTYTFSLRLPVITYTYTLRLHHTYMPTTTPTLPYVYLPPHLPPPLPVDGYYRLPLRVPTVGTAHATWGPHTPHPSTLPALAPQRTTIHQPYPLAAHGILRYTCLISTSFH